MHFVHSLSKEIFTSILFFVIFLARGQSINIETEHFKSVKEFEIKSYNGCVKEGFRAIYIFDNNGRAIESKHFFKRQLRAKFKYNYNNADLLTKEIQVYDINNKNRTDTTFYSYVIDSSGKLQSRKMLYGNNLFSWTNYYKDYDENGFPKTIVSENERHYKRIQQREYDTPGNIAFITTIENDTLFSTDERKHDRYNNLKYREYIILPKPIIHDSSGFAIHNQERVSRIENYEYTYDRLNRWIEKYMIYDEKKVLVETRKYR